MPKLSLTSLSQVALRSASVPRVIASAVAVVLLAAAGQASFSTSSPSTYVVRSGDNLWTIATNRHLTVSQLATANGLDPNRILRIGTHLTIPSAGSAAAQDTPSGVLASSSQPSSGQSFCATFAPRSGAWGVLPSWLVANPSRLALRPIMVAAAERYGVSPALVEAIAWQESGWQEGVVSSASAVGIGQLLPSTAAFVSQILVGTNLDINSASDNIRMEARYLAYLQGYLGSTCATIAGYYEGLQNMRSWGVLSESEPYVASVESLIPNFE